MIQNIQESSSGAPAPRRTASFLAALACSLVASCSSTSAPLAPEPWSEFEEGHTLLGATAGWGSVQGKVRAAGKSGILTGESGADTTDLTVNYMGAVRLHRMLTDNFALGGLVEARSFDPDSLRPLSATMSAEDFETLHFALSSRYFLDAFEGSSRWRPYFGLDLAYVPEVDLGSVDVTYSPGSGIPGEQVNISTSDFWTLTGVAGLHYLVSDDWVLEMGAQYEYALTTADSTVTFQNLGGAQADLSLRTQGLIAFFGLTYSF